MVGASAGVVLVKVNCSQIEFGINFEGFTGSIGDDRTKQTTTSFLGVGAEAGALNRLPGAAEVNQRAVVGGKAGFFIESTGGHISDFGVRASGGMGAMGAEATVGFGARGAVDGLLDARDLPVPEQPGRDGGEPGAETEVGRRPSCLLRQALGCSRGLRCSRDSRSPRLHARMDAWRTKGRPSGRKDGW